MALDTLSGKIFCYLTSRYHEATGTLKSADGEWDLEHVKESLAAGQPIELARLGATDKVEVSRADFDAAVDAEVAKRASAAQAEAAAQASAKAAADAAAAAKAAAEAEAPLQPQGNAQIEQPPAEQPAP